MIGATSSAPNSKTSVAGTVGIKSPPACGPVGPGAVGSAGSARPGPGVMGCFASSSCCLAAANAAEEAAAAALASS